MFDRKAKLNLHILIHTKERPFKCTFSDCSCSFNRKHHLELHQLVHTSSPKPFTCSQCNKNFVTSSTLKRHELKIHPTVEECNKLQSDQMECNLCSAILKKRSMKNHMKTIHDIPNYKSPSLSFTCNICGFEFDRKQAYLSHLKAKSHSVYELPYEKGGSD